MVARCVRRRVFDRPPSKRGKRAISGSAGGTAGEVRWLRADVVPRKLALRERPDRFCIAFVLAAFSWAPSELPPPARPRYRVRRVVYAAAEYFEHLRQRHGRDGAAIRVGGQKPLERASRDRALSEPAARQGGGHDRRAFEQRDRPGNRVRRVFGTALSELRYFHGTVSVQGCGVGISGARRSDRIGVLCEIESKGIVGLGWGSGGFKEIETSTKAVAAPEDLKGLRIRIPNGAIYVATYQALGAIPVPIDVSETFTALTQKTVDGMDVNLDVVATGKYFTVVKHIALSHHVLSVLPLMMSKRKYDALGAPLQKILREEAHAAVLAWRERIGRETATTIAFLKSNGVAFTDIQYPAFKKAVEPVYATLQSKLGGDMLQRVSRAAG